MRILLLMDPFIPVPPKYYGGIERVVYDIAFRYVVMGHSVTIVAGNDSLSPDRLITYGKEAKPQSIQIDFKLLLEVTTILYKEIPKHDIVHNFGRLAWLFPIAWTKIRKVHTYMRYITPKNVKYLNTIGVKNIVYTGVSDAIVRTGFNGGGEWKTIYNCASINLFSPQFQLIDDAPLVFLGRLERCKGAHNAIKVAQLSKRRLIIAGNISELEEERNYFEQEIKKHIDGKEISYIGPVDNLMKQQILSNAFALLMPIEWFEPFPVVLVESYACGTPVLAFYGGGMSEGVIDGVTGYMSESIEEMVYHVSQISKIDRKKCREIAENLYGDVKIANDYLKVYQKN